MPVNKQTPKISGSGIPDRLGYPADSKLLIIHADDLGITHSENLASIRALEKGIVRSGSIMVPCPWFPEIAAYAREHPELDLGLHGTLNSEWKHCKWGPVLAPSQVSSLVTGELYFHPSREALQTHGKSEDVERELRAQIERALDFGINLTHMDAHMFSVYVNPEFTQVYKKLGREYELPVLLSREVAERLAPEPDQVLDESDLVVDRLIMPLKFDDQGLIAPFYTNALRNLDPGLSVLLIHAAYNDEEMKAATVGFHEFGSAWRQEDLDFFTSETCRKILEEEQIITITWKEIRKMIYGKD